MGSKAPDYLVAVRTTANNARAGYREPRRLGDIVPELMRAVRLGLWPSLKPPADKAQQRGKQP